MCPFIWRFKKKDYIKINNNLIYFANIFLILYHISFEYDIIKIQ